MPHEFDVGGVRRVYDFNCPLAWSEYIRQLGRGLPVVIALHDADEDPATFRNNWPFHGVAMGPQGAPMDLATAVASGTFDAQVVYTKAPIALEDRYFVFYPQALGYRFAITPQDVELPTERVWNYGWDTRGTATADDVAFIAAMLDHMATYLQEELDERGIPHPPYDLDRIFLFGYGAGGSMAYRLVAESPAYAKYAALYVLNGAFGGRAGLALVSPPEVRHAPQPGAWVTDVSLYHHWGHLDRTYNQNGPGLTRSNADLVRFQSEDANIGVDYVRLDLPAADAVAAFEAQFDGNYIPAAGAADALGGTTGFLTLHSAGTKEVVHYQDPTMDHHNLLTAGHRYVWPEDVWTWFKSHPRASAIAAVPA